MKPALILARAQHRLRPEGPLPVRLQANGGGAVLGGPWLVRAGVRVPRGHPLVAHGPVNAARWFGSVHQRWLGGIGITDACMYEGPPIDHWSCFAGRGPGEMLAGDRKITGIAQAWRKRDVFLVSATLISPVPWQQLCDAMGHSSQAPHLAASAVSCEECLAAAVDPVELAGSLRKLLAATLAGFGTPIFSTRRTPS